ncbi:MAG TPA: alpha/beta hydrolase, partial [Myxococcaceae bacterium]
LVVVIAAGCGEGSPQLRSVEAAGISMSYLERPAGKGRLVVLLHGFPDTPHTWDAISAELHARGYRTAAPYLRGYPPTGLPPEDTTMVRLGQDVIALMDALHEDQAIVIGQDWGAIAAYAAANLAPERVSRLVTVAIPHPLALAMHPEAFASSPHFATFAQPDAAEHFRANDFAQLDSTLALWSPTWSFPGGEIAGVKDALSKPGVLEAVLGYYRAAAGSGGQDPLLYQQTAVPALTLYGTRDGALSNIPFADQQAGFSMPVRVVPLDSGHFVHREREAETVDEIVRFLGE